MNLRSSLLLIWLCLLSPIGHSSDSCKTIFVTESNLSKESKDLGEYGVNAKIMAPHYISMFRDIKNAAGINSPGGILTTDLYNHASKSLVTLVTRFQPKANTYSVDEQFQIQAKENIKFVLNNYSFRRYWSPQILEQLRLESERYAEQSTYIEVKTLNQDTSTPDLLIGTLKLVGIHPGSHLQSLPMENDFHLQLPTNAGRKFEPSNFSVDKTQGKLSLVEIFSQLILHAREQLKKPNHEPNKLMYYTPADLFGLRMYSKLGFRIVPGHESPLIENSENWWIIGASAETIANLPNFLLKNKAHWETNDIEWMNSLVNNFEGLQGAKVEFQGHRTKQVKLKMGQVQEIGVFLSEPFSHKSRTFKRLSILSFGPGDIELNFRIPESELPLKNGWISGESKYFKMFYKDGVLKIYDKLFKMKFQLKIDNALIKPEYLQYTDRKNIFTAIF